MQLRVGIIALHETPRTTFPSARTIKAHCCSITKEHCVSLHSDNDSAAGLSICELKIFHSILYSVHAVASYVQKATDKFSIAQVVRVSYYSHVFYFLGGL